MQKKRCAAEGQVCAYVDRHELQKLSDGMGSKSTKLNEKGKEAVKKAACDGKEVNEEQDVIAVVDKLDAVRGTKQVQVGTEEGNFN